MACPASCSERTYGLLLFDIRYFPALVILALTILSAAVAQSGRATLQRSDTEILFLGTGGGPPLDKDRRERNAIRCGERLLDSNPKSIAFLS